MFFCCLDSIGKREWRWAYSCRCISVNFGVTFPQKCLPPQKGSLIEILVGITLNPYIILRGKKSFSCLVFPSGDVDVSIFSSEPSCQYLFSLYWSWSWSRDSGEWKDFEEALKKDRVFQSAFPRAMWHLTIYSVVQTSFSWALTEENGFFKYIYCWNALYSKHGDSKPTCGALRIRKSSWEMYRIEIIFTILLEQGTSRYMSMYFMLFVDEINEMFAFWRLQFFFLVVVRKAISLWRCSLNLVTQIPCQF